MAQTLSLSAAVVHWARQLRAKSHVSPKSLYANPPPPLSFQDCYFYHVMEIPGHDSPTSGEWDLRTRVDDYLGHIPVSGQRILEIGPASGFLTFELEKRGADVVAVEVADDPGWDFVPYPAAFLETVYPARRNQMRLLKNSFWYAHAAHKSKAKLYYGDVYNLPEALGRFDIAVMTSVLLHTHSPLRIIEQCAKKANTLIITDMRCDDLEGRPVCRLVPHRDNNVWDTWWQFSTDAITQFLGVLGFTRTNVTTHTQHYLQSSGKIPLPLFTIVAQK